MSGLADAITWVQTQTRALAGVRLAPQYPPDILNDFPAIIAYEGPGDIRPGASGEYTMLYSINIDAHVARKDMQRDLVKLRPLLVTVPAFLLAATGATLGGNVSTYSNITFSGLIGLLPASQDQVPTIGYRWVIQGVKIRP